MKLNLLKTILFLSILTQVSFAFELNNYEAQSIIESEAGIESQDCLPHTDYDYKRLLLGHWRFDELFTYKNNQYYTNLEFGTTGMVKITLLDINNASQVFNEAYGYYDIKNSHITITLYNESRPEVGLANNEPYILTLSCACSNQAALKYKNSDYVLTKI